MLKSNRARSAELGHDALDAANSAEWLPAQSDPRFDSADSSLAAGLSQNETQPVMSDAANIAVTLTGPGGAGKSTVGVLLAERLGMSFVDLDRRFEARAGDISQYINRFGYSAYARENVETYRSLTREGGRQSVVALSSGFMTYPQDIHSQYALLRRRIEQSPTTFVLVPSLNREICVAETVRRQLVRPFARPAGREEAVIRERFSVYVGLRARKIETMRPLAEVVDELVAAIQGEFLRTDACR